MTPLELVEKAYDKDFRWWFLALLVCVLGGGIWIVRYLIKTGEKSQSLHSEYTMQLVSELKESREKHQARMETLTNQAFQHATEFAKVVASNTAESNEVRKCIENFQRANSR